MKNRRILLMHLGNLHLLNPLTQIEQPLEQALQSADPNTALSIVVADDWAMKEFKAFQGSNLHHRILLSMYRMLLPVKNQMLIGTLEHHISYAKRSGMVPQDWQPEGRTEGDLVGTVRKLNELTVEATTDDSLLDWVLKGQQSALGAVNQSNLPWQAKHFVVQSAMHIANLGQIITADAGGTPRDCELTFEAVPAAKPVVELVKGRDEVLGASLSFVRTGSTRRHLVHLDSPPASRKPRPKKTFRRTLPMDVACANTA